MDFNTFVRKPFEVEAIQIDESNLADAAEMIGDSKIRHKDNGEPYFLTDRRLIRSISRVEIGYWVTKMDDHFRVYRPSVFESLFVASDPAISRLFNMLLSTGGNDDVSLQAG